MTADGAHQGAIGLSGGTGDQEEACARAAPDAIEDRLQ